MSAGRGVGRLTLRTLPLALASRAAAFLVPVAIAWWFGVGPVTDAWFWALSFPTFTLVLASSALGTASLPAIAAARAEAPERLPGLLGGLITWAALVAASLGVLVALAMPPLLPVWTDFPPETRALASRYLWGLIPFMVLTCAGAVLRVACEVHGEFSRVALTPLLRAVAIIGALALLRGPLGGLSLPVALGLGELAQALWWARLLRRNGVTLRPGLGVDPSLRALARDLLPLLGGEVLVALNLVVDKGFAAALPAGSVATLEYADRARVIPQTLLESSLVMVAFATWANLRAQGRHAEARGSAEHALRWTVALASPVLAGMFIGATVLVRLLFERGAFQAQDTEAVAEVLRWFVPGLLPNLLGILAARVHVVERNLRIIFATGLISVSVNAIGNALLMGPMGLPGLALATTATSFLVPAVLLSALRGALPYRARAWRAPLGVALGSVGLAAGVALGPGLPTRWTDPWLWGAAAASLALLGLGWRAVGREG